MYICKEKNKNKKESVRELGGFGRTSRPATDANVFPNQHHIHFK